jgi:hypothetical protein
MQRHKRARHRVPPVATTPEGEPLENYRPKAGPAQEFRREFVDVKSGYMKRFRNVANTPLMLAYFRGQLCAPPGSPSKVHAEDRLAAGELFQRLWYTLHRTGMRDSTDLGIGGFSGLFFTEAKEIASERLHVIAGRMQRTNYQIVCLFCGEGVDQAEALRRAGLDADPHGPIWRIREALDDLVYATTGMRDAPDVAQKRDGSGKIHPFQQLDA